MTEIVLVLVEEDDLNEMGKKGGDGSVVEKGGGGEPISCCVCFQM